MRYFRKPSPAADFSREETLAVLERQGSCALAEQIWLRSEGDPSLRHQLGVMVLRSRIESSSIDSKQALALMDQLIGLCEFEAEWKDRKADSGWAQFLAEVISALEALLKRAPREIIRSRIQELIRTTEESVWQIDDHYQCQLEMERLEKMSEELNQQPIS